MEFKTLKINKKSPQEDISKLLFCGCFYYVIDEKKFVDNSEYNYTEFEELCAEYGIKQYTRLLYMYCVESIRDYEKDKSRYNRIWVNAKYNKQIQLAEIVTI